MGSIGSMGSSGFHGGYIERHCDEDIVRRGNAAIKQRAESSSLELCRGGAGSTEGQSHVGWRFPRSLRLLGMTMFWGLTGLSVSCFTVSFPYVLKQ